MVAAANTITALGKVALNKPKLRKRITDELIKVDTLPHTDECRNILAGQALLAIGNYIDEVKDKTEYKTSYLAVGKFAEKHLKNRRNATKKKAQKFLSSV